VPARAQDERTGESARSAEGRQKQERGLGTARGGERGKNQRRDQSPERNRRLPYAEGKPTFGGVEPPHDRPAARRVDACARSAGEREQHEQHSEALRVGGSCQADRAGAQAEGEDGALADAIGGEPPRQERHQRSRPAGCEQNADIAEAEAVLGAKRGHEHRQPDAEHGVAGLRRRAGGEYRPPVARRRGPDYSWNGFAGLVPVATITLFVSR
jgi:hypothetical protein